MKKTILAAAIIAIGFSACTDMGKEVAATDAQTVKDTKSNTSVTYTKVSTGSAMDWRAVHFGGAQPRFGKVFVKEANVVINDGTIGNATFKMDMATFTVENFPADDTENQMKLKGHLQSEDFFNIAEYPTSTFELTSIKPATGAYNSTVTGNLTILDQSKSISFDANVNITAAQVEIKSEDFTVDRTDWGLKYNVEGTAGVPLDYIIDNELGFTIDVKVAK